MSISRSLNHLAAQHYSIRHIQYTIAWRPLPCRNSEIGFWFEFIWFWHIQICLYFDSTQVYSHHRTPWPIVTTLVLKMDLIIITWVLGRVQLIIRTPILSTTILPPPTTTTLRHPTPHPLSWAHPTAPLRLLWGPWVGRMGAVTMGSCSQLLPLPHLPPSQPSTRVVHSVHLSPRSNPWQLSPYIILIISTKPRTSPSQCMPRTLTIVSIP